MKVHHIGYAVRDLDPATQVFQDLGFECVGGRTADVGRHIHVQFMRNGDYVIELVAPADEKSPIGSLLKTVGASPYHLCYETTNLVGEIDRLKADRYVVLALPATAPAIHQRNVAFLAHKHIGIIELVEAEA